MRPPEGIRRLPRWVGAFPGLVFATSAVLKMFPGGTLCTSPWEAANVVMWPVEVLLAIVLLAKPGADGAGVTTPRRRRLAGLFGALLLSGAAALLTLLHFLGPRWNLEGSDVSACGCFGPVRLPYGVHMLLLGGMIACLGAVFLHEERVLRERAGDG